jgi:hypothetical protein
MPPSNNNLLFLLTSAAAVAIKNNSLHPMPVLTQVGYAELIYSTPDTPITVLESVPQQISVEGNVVLSNLFVQSAPFILTYVGKPSPCQFACLLELSTTLDTSVQFIMLQNNTQTSNLTQTSLTNGFLYLTLNISGLLDLNTNDTISIGLIAGNSGEIIIKQAKIEAICLGKN